MKRRRKTRTKVYEPEEGYDLYADQYDDDFRNLNSFEKDELRKMIRGIEGKRVLDIGCGTGRTVRLFREQGCEVVCGDISEKMVNEIQKKMPGVDAVRADIEELPFEDESFDVVVALFVIVHLKDLVAAFDEVERVLKPGGVFILSNINQRKPPKLQTKDKEEIVIKSQYHIPSHVLEALEKSFFELEEEVFVMENKTWVNQLIKVRKPF